MPRGFKLAESRDLNTSESTCDEVHCSPTTGCHQRKPATDLSLVLACVYGLLQCYISVMELSTSNVNSVIVVHDPNI